MTTRTVEFSIFRFRPGGIDPPRFERFRIDVEAGTTVLDALECIRLTVDGSLMYRRSCHHSSCGTCACRVNGVERLACTTRVLDLKTERVRLEPLRGFERIGDLAVGMEAFYRDIEPGWSCLDPAGPAATGSSGPEAAPLRLEPCIECGCCVSACPVAGPRPDFMGPAALAALHRRITANPAGAEELLHRAGGERGERWCERALACSRVCPTGVNPARRIAGLRREVKKRFP
jgi:succinate dehydrogenase / fumarate reductase iron-sulfur subunit